MSDTVSIRAQRRQRREAEARQRGYTGEWPPPRVRLTCAADVEDCLARLEAGELRAGFISGLTFALIRLADQLRPEHFRRFGRLLVVIAENREAAHRSRLRAVEAGPRVLRQGARLLTKLRRRGCFGEARAHLAELMAAFAHEISRDAARLWAVFDELLGSGARTVSDQMRAAQAVIGVVTGVVDVSVAVKSGAFDDHRMFADDPRYLAAQQKARQWAARIVAEQQRKLRERPGVQR